jgi:hypothetical protein
MKRFTIRKVKCNAYTRQGWMYKNCGFRFVVTDREWRDNMAAVYGKFYMASRKQEEAFKNIDIFNSHAAAQFIADWLNENCSGIYAQRISIPGKIFVKAIELRDDVVV